MKHLIVNADDLGADPARNAGIAEAVEAGVVTSVSILANGPAFADAVERLRAFCRTPISCGIHVNLSEGRPLSASLPILSGPDGFFLGKAAAHRILRAERNRALDGEIRRELRAQIRSLREAGIEIIHLDGHQHVHVFPAVIEAVADVTEEEGIPWLRLPEEPPPPWEETGDRRLEEEAASFSDLARAARGLLWPRPGISATDHFRGLYLKDRLTWVRLREVLTSLPEGLTEFMVHPGRVSPTPLSGPFGAFSTAHRERELAILLGDEFRLCLAENEIQLVPFGKGPP